MDIRSSPVIVLTLTKYAFGAIVPLIGSLHVKMTASSAELACFKFSTGSGPAEKSKA